MSISNADLTDEILKLEAALKPLYELRDARIATGLMNSTTVVEVPGTTPGSTWKYDTKGLLATGWTQGAFSRIDPVVDATCPTAVFLETTKHYLSIPRPDLGETFVPYAERVSRQAGSAVVPPTNIGALFLSASKYFARFGGYKADGSNWPLVADFYFNHYLYLTPEERAEYDAGKRSWGAAYDRMQGKTQ